jgi:hypothetical protein
MNDENTTADGLSQVAGDAEQAPTLEAKQAQPDPIKNLKGEFQRKISKLDEKLNAILQSVQGRSTICITVS